MMKIIAVIPARYANTISCQTMQDLGGKQHFNLWKRLEALDCLTMFCGNGFRFNL
jgi:hypothetical protein